MPQCAFCEHVGKLSLEHVLGDWINPLFPGKKLFTETGKSREVITRRPANEINPRVKAVCAACNNTWMSNIESQHAKPAMTDLILGKMDIPIDQSRANSIAIYAFKVAVIVDHIRRRQPPFFSQRIRFAFRESRAIPPLVRMWMCAMVPFGKVHLNSSYHKGAFPATNPIELYVCTVTVGHFVFQVVSMKQIGSVGLMPIAGFENLAVPLWPQVHPGFVWPARFGLRTLTDFYDFSDRWKEVLPVLRRQSRPRRI